MNSRPSGYEPDELPGCSTPQQNFQLFSTPDRAVKRRCPSFFIFAVGLGWPVWLPSGQHLDAGRVLTWVVQERQGISGAEREGSRAAEGVAELGLCFFEGAFAGRGQLAAGAVDEEVEHGHGGLVGGSLAPAASLGGALEGLGDAPRAALGEDAVLEVEGVAAPGDVGAPARALLAGRGPRSPLAVGSRGRHGATFA